MAVEKSEVLLIPPMWPVFFQVGFSLCSQWNFIMTCLWVSLISIYSLGHPVGPFSLNTLGILLISSLLLSSPLLSRCWISGLSSSFLIISLWFSFFWSFYSIFFWEIFPTISSKISTKFFFLILSCFQFPRALFLLLFWIFFIVFNVHSSHLLKDINID